MKLTTIKAAIIEAEKFISAANTYIEITEKFPEMKSSRQKKSRELRAISFELTHSLGDMRRKQ